MFVCFTFFLNWKDKINKRANGKGSRIHRLIHSGVLIDVKVTSSVCLRECLGSRDIQMNVCVCGVLKCGDGGHAHFGCIMFVSGV